ncbi:sugar phosphate isomerase/epimerase family protein [uncultured Desulfobacter sp.]|uniref:sugar phosphate isomerase/epimerase family protein n=1 Tax=uncultured Desulfobacter sp. TaxID=240139 RepID=UPI0029F5267B|nr:sugar phosphate isomerase/epimerase family protein [uncultured Desulfobacter sp.]
MKIGVMNNPLKSVYQEAEQCGKAGFEFLDLTLEGPNAADVDTQRLKAVLEHYELCIIGHTDPCLPWAYPVPGIRDACLKELERCARIFSCLGARVMNIHPCYFCPPAMKDQRVSFHIEALPPIVDMAASHGLTLVLENYKAPFDRVSVFEKLIAHVPGLKLHLDFGHTNFGKDDHDLFCKALGAHLVHVHFSDNRSRNDDHLPLGVGTVDWQQAVDSLKSISYDNTITLEVFCNDPQMQVTYLDLNRNMVRRLWAESLNP